MATFAASGAVPIMFTGNYNYSAVVAFIQRYLQLLDSIDFQISDESGKNSGRCIHFSSVISLSKYLFMFVRLEGTKK